jgi:hypothetical protein
MRGVSQHERHEHPLVRNETRKAEAAQSSEHRKPKGFGQVWTKEEVECMLELETLLQGERFIAKKMCEFLPTKSNKQIRDKRAEATYRAQMKDRLQSQQNTKEATEGSMEAPQNANAEAANGLEGQRIISVNPIEIPTIIVEDHSETTSKEEMEWKESVIRNTLETKPPEKESSEEDTGLLELLREALQVAKDAEGLIPTAQVDHVYQAVKIHVLGNNKETQKHRSQERKRDAKGL